MANDDAKAETIDVHDLLRTLISRLTGIEGAQDRIEDVQKELRDGQQEMNVHFATLNGTVAGLQQRSQSHSGKLDDHTGVLSNLNARLAVVERVSEVQDEHLSAGVRDARSGAWEARVTAGDIRTEAVGWAREIRQAAISAVLVVALLLALAGLAVLAFG